MISVCDRNVNRLSVDDELIISLLIEKHLLIIFLKMGEKFCQVWSMGAYQCLTFCELKTAIFFKVVVKFLFQIFLSGESESALWHRGKGI